MRIFSRKAEKKAVALRPEASGIVAQDVTDKTIKDYLDAFGATNQLTETETKQFVQTAVAFQLNPIKRELYAIPYMKNMRDPENDDNWIKVRQLSLVTGYQVYLQKAELSGLLEWWKADTIMVNDRIKKAFVLIKRTDRAQPFEWEVNFEEYCGSTPVWKKQPGFMIKKVAIGQGFRLCFPNILGDMPHVQEELDATMEEVRETEPPVREIEPVVEESTGVTEVTGPRQTASEMALGMEKAPPTPGATKGTSATKTPNPYDSPAPEPEKPDLTLEAEVEEVGDAPGLKKKIMAIINSDKMGVTAKVASMKETAQAGADTAQLSALLKHLEGEYMGNLKYGG